MAKYGVNKVTLVGNLGKDPEAKYLDNGACVVNFSLATTESFKDRDGNRQDRTEWHNCVLWRGLAEVAVKYLKKGSTVYLEGRLVTRSWEGQDGKKAYRTEVEVRDMIMLGGNSSNVSSDQYSGHAGAQGGGQQRKQSQNQNQHDQPSSYVSDQDMDFTSEQEDDLPF